METLFKFLGVIIVWLSLFKGFINGLFFLILEINTKIQINDMIYGYLHRHERVGKGIDGKNLTSKLIIAEVE